ncbi:hypothetical protein [uncultured Variovorax sp.]|uniref:hypothetical protein n=1 Tax=uncultured Variovorax sp. TaxID=114708 RepID=UPI0025F10468|nr:hypothetical protein [uncultured Variovorax sp.]
MEQFPPPPSTPQLRIETGVAASRQFLIVSCSKLEERFDGFARLCLFTPDKPVQWRYFDLQLNVSAAALHSAGDPDGAAQAFVFAAEDGDIVRLPLGKPPVMERIVGAGLWDDDSEGWGYMNAVRQVGARLYACGDGGQVYRRESESGVESEGNWVHVDDGLLQPADGEHNLMLNAIDGPGEDSIYLAGWDSDRNAGLLFHRGADGAWTRISIEAAKLTGLCVEGPDAVWACGYGGALLRGSRAAGFTDVSALDDTRDYSGVAIYGGKVYLATSEGLFVREGDAIMPVDTGLLPAHVDGHVLQAVDGVLWSIGYRDIVRFDGARWERILFPGNPPIA